MKARSTTWLTGLLLGFLTGVTADRLGYLGGALTREPTVHLERSQSTSWHTRHPGSSLFAIVYARAAIGYIQLDRAGVSCVSLWNPDHTREVSLRSKSGIFPGRMIVERLAAGQPASPIMSFLDDDLDGMPDRRCDWSTREMSRLSTPRWEPAEPPTTSGDSTELDGQRSAE